MALGSLRGTGIRDGDGAWREDHKLNREGLEVDYPKHGTLTFTSKVTSFMTNFAHITFEELL
jgi:hypothetical protein